MNERIRELADKAGIHFCQDRVPETGFEYEGAEITVEDLKKFALLIVRECAGIDFRHKLGMTVEQDYNTSRVILEHFGVESPWG